MTKQEIVDLLWEPHSEFQRALRRINETEYEGPMNGVARKLSWAAAEDLQPLLDAQPMP